MPDSDDQKDINIPGDEFNWSNEGNKAFYEELKADGLEKLAEKGGLETGCDIQLLTTYWSSAENVLEVGAGYGRVIAYLLKHQFKGSITAVERCNILFKHLKKHYSKYNNVNLIHSDIWNLTLDKRFNLILMLWSEIAEFSPKEQMLIFSKLAKLLQKRGKLIIDTIPSNIIPLGASKKGQQIIYSVKINNAILHAYAPNTREIKKYAKKAGFTSLTHINYQTNTGRKRRLYLLS